MSFRRLLAFAGASIGFVGIIACALGIAAAVWVGVRLDRANDLSFAAVQKSLAAARVLVLRSQDRARELAAEDLGAPLRDWGKLQIRQDLLIRVDDKAQRVAQRLEQAQVWVQTSAESIRSINETLQVIRTVGGVSNADDGATALTAAADRIDELNDRLQQVIETITEIHQQASARLEDSAADEERIPRLTGLANGVSATLRQIETRLGESADRLSERQAGAEQLRVRVHRHIVLAVIGMAMLLAWMAAGQAALCACGWKRSRRG